MFACKENLPLWNQRAQPRFCPVLYVVVIGEEHIVYVRHEQKTYAAAMVLDSCQEVLLNEVKSFYFPWSIYLVLANFFFNIENYLIILIFSCK